MQPITSCIYIYMDRYLQARPSEEQNHTIKRCKPPEFVKNRIIELK